MIPLLIIAAAYLIGAIPFGYLIARARGIDIREHGSGNIGATNVRRVLGKPAGNLCFALDFLKGFLPTLVGGLILGYLNQPDLPAASALLWLAIGFATIAGHMFPVYLKFKGGKGVATGFGVLLAAWPHVTIPAALALVTWIVTLRLTRYVGVASCAAAIAVPVFIVLGRLLGFPTRDLLSAWPWLAVTTLLALLVVYRHRGNLARVRAGTEPRVGEARGPSETDETGSAPGEDSDADDRRTPS
ncbi:MAG: glycerol-3-phosphate 1-O-acyltransferase PlsY [Planctomycetota bacterium]